MAIQECDDRGRLVINKEIRDKYGERFAVIQGHSEVILIPIPQDPLADLQKEGEKLPKGRSVADLKERARELALREVLQRRQRAIRGFERKRR